MSTQITVIPFNGSGSQHLGAGWISIWW